MFLSCAAPDPILKKLLHRLRISLAWKQRQAVIAGQTFLARLGWRKPWSLRPPFTRAKLRLYSHGGGIGDELMCTPIFREIRRRNPRCHLTFVTRHPEIFRLNPQLDAVELFSPEAARDAIDLTYGPVVPPPRPLITLMAECVGLDLVADELDAPEFTPTPELRQRRESWTRPLIVIQPQASHWTPNKQWPVAAWQELIGRLVAEFEVVEVGKETLFPQQAFGAGFHSLAGATSMADFAWIIGQAAVFIGPASGGMHFARAFRVRSVIIFGGYESPSGYNYPLTQAFYTPVPCAPCWLTSPCPYDRKCLSAIGPDAVFQAVRAAALDPQWTPQP